MPFQGRLRVMSTFAGVESSLASHAVNKYGCAGNTVGSHDIHKFMQTNSRPSSLRFASDVGHHPDGDKSKIFRVAVQRCVTSKSL